MNDDELRGEARRLAFLYQDGLVLATTLRGLAAVGLAAPDLAGAVKEAQERLPQRGFAHVQIGLRSLAQAGWVTDVQPMEWTQAGRDILANIGPYLEVAEFLARFHDSAAGAWSKAWSEEAVRSFIALAELASGGWSLTIVDPALRGRVAAHLDGALLTPLLLSLQATHRLGKDRPTLDHDAFGEAQRRLLENAGSTSLNGAWSPQGLMGMQFVSHLGLTASYLPLLSCLPDLYRGIVPALAVSAEEGREWHVQRELNIAASAAAHRRYFADADEMIARVFDCEPLEAQPRFVLDVGCGDGSWLAHVDQLIRDGTRRGRHLDSHPLDLVGVDHSSAALDRAHANLAGRGVSVLLVEGDISDPEALGHRLRAHGLDISEGLHLHAFIDHDRHIRRPGGSMEQPRPDTYLDGDGEALTPDDAEADLARHLERWAPHVARYGMIALEAHRVPPRVAASEQGTLHSIAFDAYHGYSRQYPLDRPAYLSALRRAGFREAASEGRSYPSTRAATAVSLSRLFYKPDHAVLPDGRPAEREDAGPEDGLALHRLLYHDGDLRSPRDWCGGPTRTLVAQAMDALEQAAEASKVLRVCDYGTGTGLAAIELLKACGERGFAGRVELHLVDLPSDWFAQGRALLGGCPDVSFHSLLDDRGRFRSLGEVLGGREVDLLLASMVFHLIPASALSRVTADMADVIAPGGTLLWNAPDLADAAPNAVLFHDPNRALRKEWKRLLDGQPPRSPAQAEAVARATAAGATIDDVRADRRVLPVPNRADVVAAAFSPHFTGEVVARPYEMTAAESLDAILVPSNNQELLPEIADDDLRRAVVRELMTTQILPAFCNGPAGTGNGFAVHWTGGSHRRR